MTVPFQCAFLAAIGHKAVHINPQWHARPATIAIRSVGEQTTSAKSFGDQFRVGVVVDEMAGGCHL